MRKDGTSTLTRSTTNATTTLRGFAPGPFHVHATWTIQRASRNNFHITPAGPLQRADPPWRFGSRSGQSPCGPTASEEFPPPRHWIMSQEGDKEGNAQQERQNGAELQQHQIGSEFAKVR